MEPIFSDYPLDCTGDACTGDEIIFTEAVFNGSYRNPVYAGERVIAARIIRDSYGAAKQQHTFTLEIIASAGVAALTPGQRTTRKGRNVYRNGTWRKAWECEAERKAVLADKHGRGAEARAARDERKGAELFGRA